MTARSCSIENTFGRRHERTMTACTSPAIVGDHRGVTSELVPQRLLLIGMMGSGKSTIGRGLPAATGWQFLDNDELLERRTGRTARDLRAAGVDALRDGESAALHEGIA